MTVSELNREQITALKAGYMVQLADEGIFGEIIYNDERIFSPSYNDLINADELIPDELISEHFDGVYFTEEDFAG